MKKIMIVEPSPIVQEGLRKIIEATPEFSVEWTLYDTNRLKEHCLSHNPDIVIFNPSLIGMSAKNSIRHTFEIDDETPLVAIIYSFFDNEILSQFDAEIGINDNNTRIINKLQTLKNDTASKSKTESESLSDRENEILVAIAKGMTNKEIAEKYYISIHTVISHRKNIVKKTGIKTVSGLTVYALLNNLISYDDIE